MLLGSASVHPPSGTDYGPDKGQGWRSLPPCVSELGRELGVGEKLLAGPDDGFCRMLVVTLHGVRGPPAEKLDILL